jgi:thioredoxin reductase (NADPH)
MKGQEMPTIENVVIAGSGPAGLTAAIYTARAALEPLVLEGHVPGGQLIVCHEVENYPGLADPISGMELMDRFRSQAQRFGARFHSEAVEKVDRHDGVFRLVAGSRTIDTKTLVIATGAQARRLVVPTEPRFYGRGVSGCAVCDGPFFRDKEVLVIGGGNTAMQDALYLTRFSSKVTIVHRREQLRATPIEVQKAKKNPKIEWMVPWIVDDILGKDRVEGVVLRNPKTGETREVGCAGIFVAIGHDPKGDVFKSLVSTDQEGYIKVESGSTRTSMPGIFACGDICDAVYRQAVLAAGRGCMAAMDVERYLAGEK